MSILDVCNGEATSVVINIDNSREIWDLSSDYFDLGDRFFDTNIENSVEAAFLADFGDLDWFEEIIDSGFEIMEVFL